VELVGRPRAPGRAEGTARWVSGPLALPLRPAAPGGLVLCAREVVALPHPGPEPFSAAALVLGEPEPALPVPPGVPAVGDIPPELISDGDRVTVDGDAGWVDLPEVNATPVVTSFLERSDGRILLLKRSEKVGSFRGRWAGISGYLELATPIEQAYREVEEETGISPARLTLVTVGTPLFARGEGRAFEVHPFHFRVHDPEVLTDWEHTESQWVAPSQIRGLPTVPRLWETWQRVATDSRDRRGPHGASRKP
jgi:8-oxo-dGTP diphosphatase